MSDHREPALPEDPAIRAGSDEALSAYLTGELDEQATAAFERRLADEPGLTARLDALAGALVALSGVEDVVEPEGFAARLDTRLAAERDVADLWAHRERRNRWSAVLTAAAGVVVLAVAGLQVLTGPVFAPRGDSETAMDEDAGESAVSLGAPAPEELLEGTSQSLRAGDAPSSYSATVEPDSAPAPDSAQDSAQDSAAVDTVEGGGGADGAPPAGSATSDAPAAESAPAMGDGPVIVDEGAALDTDDDLRARYRGLPESERFRGASRDQAAETAAFHADAVRAAEPFPGTDVRPDRCLDEVRGGPDARIVTRVERVHWQGGEALVYALALPGPDAAVVDTFQVWVMGPQGCDTRRFLEWR